MTDEEAVPLSEEARAILAGLLGQDVDDDEVEGCAWGELRAAFPPKLWQQWLEAHPIDRD